jgi:hypothetical protein
MECSQKTHAGCIPDGMQYFVTSIFYRAIIPNGIDVVSIFYQAIIPDGIHVDIHTIMHHLFLKQYL